MDGVNTQPSSDRGWCCFECFRGGAGGFCHVGDCQWNVSDKDVSSCFVVFLVLGKFSCFIISGSVIDFFLLASGNH